MNAQLPADGVILVTTDAAAVFNVLRRAPLPRRLTSLLEVESGANDPMAIMLTIGALAAWQGAPAASEWVLFAVRQLGGGLLLGAVVALVGCELLNRVRLGAAGLYPVVALAIAGLSYGVAAWAGASGFLAVYVAGLLVGARVPRHRRPIRNFHDGLASAAGIGLFLLLGILVFPSQLPEVALPALAVTAVLVFIARPVAPVAEVLPLEDPDAIDAELVEVDISRDLHVAERSLQEVPLPRGGLATTLLRGDRVLIPTGSTRLADGDVLLVAMPERRGAAEALVAWARGESSVVEAEEPAPRS